LKAKINTASFYAAHILPQANMQVEATMKGAQSVVEAVFD